MPKQIKYKKKINATFQKKIKQIKVFYYHFQATSKVSKDYKYYSEL